MMNVVYAVDGKFAEIISVSMESHCFLIVSLAMTS